MNRKHLLHLANAIEADNTTINGEPLAFNMSVYFNSHSFECGTAACIAGWARAIWGIRAAGTTFRAAADVLKLTDEEADNLFLAYGMPHLSEITAEHAVRTLRHAAETGVIDWIATKEDFA
jgi:hypothetical protein